MMSAATWILLTQTLGHYLSPRRRSSPSHGQLGAEGGITPESIGLLLGRQRRGQLGSGSDVEFSAVLMEVVGADGSLQRASAAVMGGSALGTQQVVDARPLARR